MSIPSLVSSKCNTSKCGSRRSRSNPQEKSFVCFIYPCPPQQFIRLILLHILHIYKDCQTFASSSVVVLSKCLSGPQTLSGLSLIIYEFGSTFVTGVCSGAFDLATLNTSDNLSNVYLKYLTASFGLV